MALARCAVVRDGEAGAHGKGRWEVAVRCYDDALPEGKNRIDVEVMRGVTDNWLEDRSSITFADRNAAVERNLEQLLPIIRAKYQRPGRETPIRIERTDVVEIAPR